MSPFEPPCAVQDQVPATGPPLPLVPCADLASWAIVSPAKPSAVKQRITVKCARFIIDVSLIERNGSPCAGTQRHAASLVGIAVIVQCRVETRPPVSWRSLGE